MTPQRGGRRLYGRKKQVSHVRNYIDFNYTRPAVYNAASQYLLYSVTAMLM